MISESDYKRICWASRRGMLELDLILVPFVENCFPQLSALDQQRYINLMEGEDTDMFSWLLGREQPADAETAAIIEQIIAYKRSH